MRKIPILVTICAIGAMSTLLVDRSTRPPSTESASDESDPVLESVASLDIEERGLPKKITETEQNWLSKTRQQLSEQLNQQNYSQAFRTFDRAYNQASSDEVRQLHTLMITHAARLSGAGKHQAVVQALGQYARTYDDLDAWRMLVSAFQATEQWQNALDALLRTNQLEVDSERYQHNLRAMVQAASALSTEHLRNNNGIAVLELYQNLYEQYPQHPRFQFDLASAQLALGAQNKARPLLQALVYDPDLGQLAQQKLDLLNAERNSELAEQEREQEKQRDSARQIVVPLIRAGTSLLVDAKIDGSDSRLLLDTGASITALSTQRIRQLGLQATGQSIRLSTANGVTTAQLYRADSLSIGRINFRDLVVAEIDLSAGSNVDGLLGTDVLRKMNERYSYLIDDQRNALIFRARP